MERTAFLQDEMPMYADVSKMTEEQKKRGSIFILSFTLYFTLGASFETQAPGIRRTRLELETPRT